MQMCHFADDHDSVEEVNTTESRIGDDEAIKMPVLERGAHRVPPH